MALAALFVAAASRADTYPRQPGVDAIHYVFRLTVDEIIAGVTREAARALGRLPEAGSLETGKWCDLAIWNVERLAELPYRMGFNPLHTRVWRGR